MKNADKNRDPERARKRAFSDLRCAMRKLSMVEILREVAAAANATGRNLGASMRDELTAMAQEWEENEKNIGA